MITFFLAIGLMHKRMRLGVQSTVVDVWIMQNGLDCLYESDAQQIEKMIQVDSIIARSAPYGDGPVDRVKARLLADSVIPDSRNSKEILETGDVVLDAGVGDDHVSEKEVQVRGGK